MAHWLRIAGVKIQPMKCREPAWVSGQGTSTAEKSPCLSGASRCLAVGAEAAVAVLGSWEVAAGGARQPTDTGRAGR